jgi:hypothetical protein
MPKRTADDVYVLVETQVIPRIDRVEKLAEKAGLNGFGGDIHDFFEQRAESAVALSWVKRKLHPLVKFKYVIAAAGFISTVAWAVLAIRQLVVALPHPH